MSNIINQVKSVKTYSVQINIFRLQVDNYRFV